jgi:copper chaperone NosL
MRQTVFSIGVLGGMLLATACGGGPSGPADLDTANEQCANCRMAVSDARFASQLVAPGEVPQFFDDLGCLVERLETVKDLPAGAVAFVADHRSRAWVRADRAAYSRVPELDTPMNSHLVAHADETSRAADDDARGGSPVPVSELFGPGGPPAGGAR